MANDKDTERKSPGMVADHLVCLLDVLGFESLLLKVGIAEMRRRYDLLIAAVRTNVDGQPVMGRSAGGGMAMFFGEVQYAYFSDTLLFWFESLDSVAVDFFVGRMLELLCLGVEIELPMRGAISYGPAIFDKEAGVYLGKPIIECARTEKIQDWIGATLCSPFKDPARGIGFFMDQILPYKSGYKEEFAETIEATGASLDWPRHWRTTRVDSLKDRLEKLNPGGPVARKYQNTIQFIEFSDRKHDWFKRGEPLEWG